ncbi:MAG: hypothetical protein ACE5HC_12725, partial [Candidatus Binatia bacterium]
SATGSSKSHGAASRGNLSLDFGNTLMFSIGSLRAAAGLSVYKNSNNIPKLLPTRIIIFSHLR